MDTEGLPFKIQVSLPVTARPPPPRNPACSYRRIVGRDNRAPPGFVHGSFRIIFSFPQASFCLYFFVLSLFFLFFSSTLCANISGWICYHLPDSWQFILYSAHSGRRKQTSKKKKCSHKQYLYKHWGLSFRLSFLSFSGIANRDYHEDPFEQPPSGPAGGKLFLY